VTIQVNIVRPYWSSKPRVGGSNPSGRANKIKHLLRNRVTPGYQGGRTPAGLRVFFRIHGQLVLFDESGESAFARSSITSLWSAARARALSGATVPVPCGEETLDIV
jgi:hypothetical protein